MHVHLKELRYNRSESRGEKGGERISKEKLHLAGGLCGEQQDAVKSDVKDDGTRQTTESVDLALSSLKGYHCNHCYHNQSTSYTALHDKSRQPYLLPRIL